MPVKNPVLTKAKGGKPTGLGSLGALRPSLLGTLVPTLAISLLVLAFAHESASAAPASAAWAVTSQWSDFAPGDNLGGAGAGYFITATNTGAAPTDGSPVTLTDNLPAGLTVDTVDYPGGPVGGDDKGSFLSCSTGPSPATCTDSIGSVPPGFTIYMWVPVDVVAAPPAGVTNQVSVGGGGLATVSASSQTPISATPSGFGVQSMDAAMTGPGGAAVSQAGSHPYQVRVSFAMNMHADPNVSVNVPNADPKDLTVNLPAGLVVNPNATPRCTEVQFEGGSCPDATAVGTVTVITGTLSAPNPSAQTSPIYNLVPPPGAPAALGFDAVGLGIFEHILGRVRTGGDYGLSATIPDLPQRGIVLGAITTLWGNPSDPSHDQARGGCIFRGFGTSCPVPPTGTAFLTMPSACSGPLTTTISADSWQSPGAFVNAGSQTHDPYGNPVGVSGCSTLDFTPSISVQPDTSVADSPSGLSVDLKIPQNTDLNTLAEASLKDAVVTLPAGMAVNPSAANGLQACPLLKGEEGKKGEQGINLESSEPANCPDVSKLGSAEVDTPLLDHPLPGSVYLAKQGDNPFNSLLAIYLAINDPATGVVVKLAGHVEADPNTGQLTTTFANNPQLPFSDLKLHFFGGLRAPFITPPSCGTFQTQTSLTPWSGTPAVTPSDTFSINTGCGGGFAPSFTAGTTNNQAGGNTPFSVTFSRQDGEQRLGGITVHTPPGLLGKIAGVPRCGEAQANTGTCPPASQIGTTTAGAGAGPDQFYVPEAGQPPNPVYLTGPYKGAPFGLSIVTHALAGPFDLGNVIVRAAINLDPHTAQITVTSDPLPTILQGIPLDLRTVNVTVDRPGFMFNPTNCAPLSVTGTIASTNGASAGVSSPFEAANCANLPFKPSFTVSTQGKTSKANGASLVVKVAQKPGEANIHKVNLQLPLALPSRLTTLQKACTASQFESNPAGCPEGSFVGTATAHTPLLAVPLTGPAILVSHGGAAFPDVVFVLQGEGIRIDLVGNTDIKKGVTFSRFETVPDAPISSFETRLPEGPHSILGTNIPASANHSLCGQKLVMPTTIVGQNGAQVTQSTNIAVTGCGKPSIKITKAKIEGNTVLVTVTTTQQGTVTVSGNGLKTIKKTLGAGAHQLKVSLTKNGRTARKHHKKIKVKASVKNSNGSSSKTITLKL
jgi:hypothetical protein